MKKTILVLAAAFFCGMTTYTFAQAQRTKNILFLGAASMLETAATPATGINTRAMHDFKKNFPNAESVEWSKTKNAVVAHFIQQDVRGVVVYNQHGDWQYTINYYGEQHLPTTVRAQVKSTYFDCSITGVDEVHVQDKTVYFVHMQDATTWKKVRVCDGEMELIEDFAKG